MADYWSGANSQIMMGNEVTFNACPGTPVGSVFRKASFHFTGIEEEIPDTELRADPNPADTQTGMQRVTAQLTALLNTDEFLLLMYWFLGSYAVTGAADPYTHTGKISATDPSSVWVEVGDTGVGKYDLFNGLYIQSISWGTLRKDSSSLIQVVVDFWASGKYTRNGAASQDAAPNTFTVACHTMPALEVKVDDTATTLVEEVSYTLSRNIKGYGPLDGTLYFADADLGKYVFACTIAGWREAADTIYGYDDDAEHGLELKSLRPGVATHWVSLDHNECKIRNTKGQRATGDDGPCIQEMQVSPFYSDHADASAVVMTCLSAIVDISTATYQAS